MLPDRPTGYRLVVLTSPGRDLSDAHRQSSIGNWSSKKFGGHSCQVLQRRIVSARGARMPPMIASQRLKRIVSISIPATVCSFTPSSFRPTWRRFRPNFIRTYRGRLIGTETFRINVCYHKIFRSDGCACQPAQHCELAGVGHRI
jgi:hypothetical protein